MSNLDPYVSWVLSVNACNIMSQIFSTLAWDSGSQFLWASLGDLGVMGIHKDSLSFMGHCSLREEGRGIRSELYVLF
jgi:hypothetical protein